MTGHDLDLQFDTSGQSGTEVSDFTWEDFRQNSSEGTTNKNLQSNLPGLTGPDLLAGREPPMLYGGVAKWVRSGVMSLDGKILRVSAGL